MFFQNRFLFRFALDNLDSKHLLFSEAKQVKMNYLYKLLPGAICCLTLWYYKVSMMSRFFMIFHVKVHQIWRKMFRLMLTPTPNANRPLQGAGNAQLQCGTSHFAINTRSVTFLVKNSAKLCTKCYYLWLRSNFFWWCVILDN